MNAAGRPLRFLGWLVGGWICLRAAMLMSPLWDSPRPPGRILAHSLPRERNQIPPASPDPVVGEGTGVAVALERGEPPILANAGLGSLLRTNAAPADAGLGPVPVPSQVVPQVAAHASGPAAIPSNSAARPSPTAAPAFPKLSTATTAAGRWSATAWMLWRPEADSGGVRGPLLGGSQAGGRIDYSLIDSRAGLLSLYGRASRALTGPSAEEGALGLAWRPAASPISLLVERRQRIGPGGRNGFAVMAAGGFGPRDVAPRVEADAYVQAGIVGLPGRDGFIDGKGSLGYRMLPAPSRTSITLGASLAGSIQPRAQRLDVGPEVRLRAPSAFGGMRLSAEWRARVAGKARPASGPAITLVADF